MNITVPSGFHSRFAGALLFFAFTYTSAALADRDQCENPETTAAMHECENSRYQKADAELNRIYHKLSARLDEIGRKKLRLAQRAWIQFRDLNAQFIADSVRGGTLEPLLMITSKADMTETRIKAFERQLP